MKHCASHTLHTEIINAGKLRMNQQACNKSEVPCSSTHSKLTAHIHECKHLSVFSDSNHQFQLYPSLYSALVMYIIHVGKVHYMLSIIVTAKVLPF